MEHGVLVVWVPASRWNHNPEFRNPETSGCVVHQKLPASASSPPKHVELRPPRRRSVQAELSPLARHLARAEPSRRWTDPGSSRERSRLPWRPPRRRSVQAELSPLARLSSGGAVSTVDGPWVEPLGISIAAALAFLLGLGVSIRAGSATISSPGIPADC